MSERVRVIVLWAMQGLGGIVWRSVHGLVWWEKEKDGEEEEEKKRGFGDRKPNILYTCLLNAATHSAGPSIPLSPFKNALSFSPFSRKLWRCSISCALSVRALFSQTPNREMRTGSGASENSLCPQKATDFFARRKMAIKGEFILAIRVYFSLSFLSRV